MIMCVLTMFPLDNIDWDEYTPYGKNTTHMLMISNAKGQTPLKKSRTLFKKKSQKSNKNHQKSLKFLRI